MVNLSCIYFFFYIYRFIPYIIQLCISYCICRFLSYVEANLSIVYPLAIITYITEDFYYLVICKIHNTWGVSS